MGRTKRYYPRATVRRTAAEKKAIKDAAVRRYYESIAGTCGRCGQPRRFAPLPDGTPAYSCGCTDALTAAFGGTLGG